MPRQGNIPVRRMKIISRKKKPKEKRHIGTMDIILIIVGVCLFSFTIEMIHVFLTYGAIPDTLVSCVFVALGGECGIMGWIKTSKVRHEDREWQLEDKKAEEAKAKADAEIGPEEAHDKNDL